MAKIYRTVAPSGVTVTSEFPIMEEPLTNRSALVHLAFSYRFSTRRVWREWRARKTNGAKFAVANREARIEAGRTWTANVLAVLPTGSTARVSHDGSEWHLFAILPNGQEMTGTHSWAAWKSWTVLLSGERTAPPFVMLEDAVRAAAVRSGVLVSERM